MKTIAQRIAYIEERLRVVETDSQKLTYSIKHWRGEHIIVPKIIVMDHEYLMFRIDNSRTEIQQLSYLRKHPELPKDFFNDPESEAVQTAQEEILEEINKKESGSEFYEDLKARGQEEPAIITIDGYIVNGNRRTAALKSLGVRYIDCVVLPKDTSFKDIYELEQQLQISKDFQAPYHWINELRNIRRGIDDKKLQYPKKEMASRLRIKLPILELKLKMIDLIDAFLIWKKIPNAYDYEKLDDAEQTFFELAKASLQNKYKDALYFNELRNAVFHIIESPPSVGRVYTQVTALIKNFDKIYSNIKNSKEFSQVKKETEDSEGKTNDLLDEILENDSPVTIFSDSTSDNNLSNEIYDIIKDIKAENAEKKGSEALYEAVSDALRNLQSLTFDESTTKIPQIKAKLVELNKVVYRLLENSKDL